MNDQTAILRPRRSVLYMPGANTRALEKAKGLAADSLILDLEDAVSPDAKAEARSNVCNAVSEGGYGNRELTIRVNGLGTIWHNDDIRAASQAGPAARHHARHGLPGNRRAGSVADGRFAAGLRRERLRL